LTVTTRIVASTTLEFLETISPNDPIWEAGGVEALVEQINGLATQKRHERTHGITEAMDALRAEIAMLPDGELGIDLSPIDDVETGSLDAAFLVTGIEALTGAIASYRQETGRTTDGIARTIAERSAVYQSISADLQLIGDRHTQLLAFLTPVRGHPSPVTVARAPNTRQVSSSAAVPIEMWSVGYFLARHGRRTGGGSAETPDELGGVGWKDAYFLFYGSLNDGRSAGRFNERLKSCRDQYDRHVDSGRRGWQGKLPELAVTVMAYWQNRPREELWEYVKQFVTR
jgi:hypothetical protein